MGRKRQATRNKRCRTGVRILMIIERLTWKFSEVKHGAHPTQTCGDTRLSDSIPNMRSRCPAGCTRNLVHDLTKRKLTDEQNKEIAKTVSDSLTETLTMTHLFQVIVGHIYDTLLPTKGEVNHADHGQYEVLRKQLRRHSIADKGSLPDPAEGFRFDTHC